MRKRETCLLLTMVLLYLSEPEGYTLAKLKIHGDWQVGMTERQDHFQISIKDSSLFCAISPQKVGSKKLLCPLQPANLKPAHPLCCPPMYTVIF